MRSPAMVMALGIFLLFAARYLAQTAIDPAAGERLFYYLACLLGAWNVYLFVLLADQAIRDRKALWDYTPDHFAIGTWVAGMNVVSGVMLPVSAWLARAASIAGLLLWLLYMLWLCGMVRRTEQRARLNGAAFLTTVATQSVVISLLRVWNEMAGQLAPLLIGLNLLGVAFYFIQFYLVWIIRGIRAQLAAWTPPNNITHGALSISILAAEMLATNLRGVAPVLLPAIEVAWVAVSLLFVAVFLFELHLLATRPGQMLKFQMANWARNFTYGMYFACTYYGYAAFPGSVMNRAAGPGTLLCLAVLVAVVNFWELSHMWAPAEALAAPPVRPAAAGAGAATQTTDGRHG